MRRRSSSNDQQNKFLKLVTLPFRALGKARDVYVRSLTSCAGRVNCGGASGGPVYAAGLPRSFSAAGSRSGGDGGEDFRELLRVASAKEARRAAAAAGGGPRGLAKSCSVGMRRIEEDEACEFGDDEVVGVRGDGVWRRRSTDVIYRRSRSHGLGSVGNAFLR